MMRVAATHLRRRVLEVERKFAPTAESIRLLTENAGRPAFAGFQREMTEEFEDTYYDYNSTLMGKGIYIRRRQYKTKVHESCGTWEAKVRVGGDFTRSAFEEFHGIEAVTQIARGSIPCTSGITNERFITTYLQKAAQFGTVRKKWLLDERFQVVLDEASFGHVVREVELRQITQEMPHKSPDNGASQQDVTSLDTDIEEFMEQYAWAFPKGEVKGKLSAYFDLQAHRTTQNSIQSSL